MLLAETLFTTMTISVNAAPEVTTPSYIVMEASTGQVICEQDADTRRSPASITKIMTLLLIFEQLKSGRIHLEDKVTTSAYAKSMGGSQVFLEEGESQTLETMIKCIAVASGNDASVAVAEYIAGSEGEFVKLMNEKAESLGMQNTHFEDCCGLTDSDDHYSSAKDVAIMSRELITKYPEVFDYTTIWMEDIEHVTAQGTSTFTLSSTNKLLKQYEWTTGLKTGSTSKALYCLSATANKDGMELIAVVMKSPTVNQRFEDAKALLNYGFAHYSLVPVYPEAPLAPVDVLLGTQGQVQPRLERDCRLLVRRGEESQVTTRLSLAADVEAPVEQGQTLGQLEVYVGDELRDTVPILASCSVDRLSVPGIFSRMLRKLLMAG